MLSASLQCCCFPAHGSLPAACPSAACGYLPPCEVSAALKQGETTPYPGPDSFVAGVSDRGGVMENWGPGDEVVTHCKGMVRDDGKMRKMELKLGTAEAQLSLGWIGN